MLSLLRLSLCCRYRLLLNYIECAPNLGTQLLEFNFLCDFLRVDHYVYRTRKASQILGDCSANPALNTIADGSFSHRPSNGDANPGIAPALGITGCFYGAKQVKRREYRGKVPPSATVNELEFSVLA
jgi:hypothetical protein